MSQKTGPKDLCDRICAYSIHLYPLPATETEGTKAWPLQADRWRSEGAAGAHLCSCVGLTTDHIRRGVPVLVLVASEPPPSIDTRNMKSDRIFR